MNVIVNAYACRPGAGSEGGMTWRWIEGLAKYKVHLYVITEGEWREEIDTAVNTSPYQEYLHFYYNPVPDRVRKMCWNQGDYRFYYYYKKWQKKTLIIAESIIAERQIDIIHHLSMIGFREPGYLWMIKEIPYIWGPIGGMSIAPLQYLSGVGINIRAKYWLKNNVSKLQLHYSPRVKKALRRADVIIGANQNSYRIIKELYPNKKVYLINETGCSDELLNKKTEKSTDCFDILWVGRFIPTKMLGLSLEIVSKLKDFHGIKFHIVGNGVSDVINNKYRKQAEKLGISTICKWHGWMDHKEVQNLMRSSDVLLFPSVVEGTPHVVLEAIANQLPVVCFDICGQGDVVDESVGMKMTLSTPQQSIVDFSSALKKLYEDRSLLRSLTFGCAERQKELTWVKKVENVMELYEGLLRS